MLKNKILYFLSVILLISSCSDSDLSSELNDAHQMSSIAIYNSVTVSSRVNAYLDGELQNKSGEELKPGEYLDHRLVLPGARRFGADVFVGNKNAYSDYGEIGLYAGKVYSVFLYGQKEQDYKIVEDDLIAAPEGSIKIRFANFNINGQRYNLNVLDGGSYQVEGSVNNLDSFGVSDFVEIDAKDYLVSITGSSIIPEEEFIDLKVQNRGVYTIWLRGDVRGSIAQSNSIKKNLTIIAHQKSTM